MGCSKEQSYSSNSFLFATQNTSYGAVTQSIEIPTMQNEILKKNSQEKFDRYLNELVSNVEQKLYNNYYLRYWIKYLDNPQKQYIIGGQQVKFLRPQISEDKNFVYFSLNFLTNDAWKFYNQSSTSSNASTDDKILFLKRVENQTNFPFNKELKDYYLDILKTSIDKSHIDIDLTLSIIDFAYNYITPYSKINSNADYKFQTGNGYNHVWTQSLNINQDKQIKVWVNNINKGLWYLTAFVVFFTISTIIFVVIFIKSKIQKKNAKSS